MTITALGGMPKVLVGAAHRQGQPIVVALGNTTVDAANEACIMVGYVFTEDGGSHTIDTSGSSSLGWRTGTVTFANAGTTVKVGLAAVDTAAGPPARAVNSTNIITFDVSASFTGGGGGITTDAWQTSVPDSGTKTIANGDLVAFAVQATARAGADSILVSSASSLMTQALPGVTIFTSSYGDQVRLPNVVITFSDGTLGFFVGGFVATIGLTLQTFNSGSSPNEYGNVFQAPVPMNVYGIGCCANLANADLVLYSDPLGTPVAERTKSFDANTQQSASNGSLLEAWFSSPYTVPANTPVAVTVKPTTVTNCGMQYKTYHAAAHQKSEAFGTNGYAVNRTSGAFAPQNSSKDRFPIGLLVGGFDDGATAGGIPASRLQLGM